MDKKLLPVIAHEELYRLTEEKRIPSPAPALIGLRLRINVTKNMTKR